MCRKAANQSDENSLKACFVCNLCALSSCCLNQKHHDIIAIATCISPIVFTLMGCDLNKAMILFPAAWGEGLHHMYGP